MDANFIDVDNNTGNDSSDIMKSFMERSDIASSEYILGWSPLHHACLYGDLDVVKTLLDNNPNMECRDYNKQTCLHIACTYNFTEVVKLLINKCNDIDCKDIFGWSSLHIACYNSNYDLVKMLINAGANVNEKNNRGDTCLHVICYNDNASIGLVSLLLENGANINTKNSHGESPYDIAKHYNSNLASFLKKDNNKRLYMSSLLIQNDVFCYYIVKKYHS